ncbi:MAG: M23 family metallopeptidase [Spirochaetales bacterium]|nr:M23 family metallopeptidase [Spirochaetales bacterium]
MDADGGTVYDMGDAVAVSRKTKKRERSVEALERLSNPGTLKAVAAVLVFGFVFLGSPPRAVMAAHSSNVGSAGFKDVAGAHLSGVVLDAAEPADEGLFYSVYKVVKGDTVSAIAEEYGVTVDSIVTFNRITNTRALAVDRLLKIPSLNGILYDPDAEDTVAALADEYEISAERIREVNELRGDDLAEGQPIFLPDARLSSFALREINGDLFSWPLRGWITSWYGWRQDPFTGARSFHTGIDIGAAHGKAVYAAMEGVVTAVGYSTVAGNYVIISHHSGYSTLYAHLSSTLVKNRQRVSTATVIGRVGSTGYSTGPHLHFTVNKNGRTLNPMTVLR